MPPNWAADRQRRMLKAVILTSRYIRFEDYTWEQMAHELGNGGKHSWKRGNGSWKDPKTQKVHPVSHQYVSQVLAAGMRYLMDHARLTYTGTGEPVMRGDKVRSQPAA
jgi:hypothetical protein